ncbi:MAG: sugar ABC transporter ATP-binding protein [Planctomycetota bacterium]|jgi:ABC-type sugar transport system ATPase subunit|nr:sugar ABC transporter ATP-binding protein [Planctomycetota bacterium]
MLHLENVSKTYGHVRALEDVSLTVNQGEIRGILGGNGSGKSTLVKIAGGTVVPDTGSLHIAGRKAAIKSPRDAKRNGIVMTSQELSVMPNLTVCENLMLCRFPVRAGVFADRRKARQTCREMLRDLGLEHRCDAAVGSLPKNELYMLEFGKALVQDSDILMLDEITSALYSENVDIVRKKLKEYKAKGKTVLFISHRMDELYSICDSVTVMRNGEAAGTFGIDEKNESELLSLMVGGDYELGGRIESTLCEKGGRPIVKADRIPIPRYGKSVSLEIAHGEIIGVAGLQGHGQAEIVRTLHGLLGDVDMNVEGIPVTIRNPRQAVEKGFAFISGDREGEGVFKEHSIADNLVAVEDLVKRKRPGAVADVLAAIKVKYANIHQNLTSLSGGNQQKVIVGRWTSTNPLLILADDPTKGIDVLARSELHALFAGMTKRGSSLVMVSSDEQELVSLCGHSDNSRVIVLYEGAIVCTLRGADITRDNIVAATIPQKNGALS